MLIGRVVGNLVSTRKNAKLEGTKLLLVQPLDLSGQARGAAVLAIDSVDAGVGDRVLLVQEGRAAQLALDRGTAAVDAAVVGVVDSVEL
jgi:ethanolamine utilization protein EutN